MPRVPVNPMDEKDRMLLKLLEEDCRTAGSVLADMLDLDEEGVRKRVQRMEEEGIIRSYSANIDWEKAGDGYVAAILELKVTPERDFGYDKIAERIAHHPQVRSLRLISGAYDFSMLVVGKDIHEVTRFVSEQIAPMEHIKETATILIMKTYKENGFEIFEKKGRERLPYTF
ncbi:transcriptional regulator, AsnC family [Methanolacinia petrolearia DSM 11571]|uniref:Transcriptional regulator, AsnC family n=2 Tax=Methanomicrobiaceae TaxID=2194 RepID=E1RCV2_METP4|nr:transcriptional regulator, AsnC family [Methanolacinia petrolearia DSM 11571]